MSSTLDDFFGSSDEVVVECLFCGGTDGELVVSIQDANGPTHWHHKTCKDANDDQKGIILTPTWDEATE